MTIANFIEKFTSNLVPLYKKVHWGYFGIISMITGVITIFLSSILYYSVEPFTFFSHWISNLGGIETNSAEFPNFSYILFSIGIIITTFFTVLFVIGLIRNLLSKDQKYKSLISIGSLCSIFSLIGILGVSLFNLNSYPVIHTYTAMLFFFGSSLMMFFFSLSIIFNKDHNWLIGLLGIFLLIPAFVFLSSFIPYLLEKIDLESLIVTTSLNLAFSRFCEWMYIFAFFIWLFVLGIYNIVLERNKKKDSKALGNCP